MASLRLHSRFQVSDKGRPAPAAWRGAPSIAARLRPRGALLWCHGDRSLLLREVAVVFLVPAQLLLLSQMTQGLAHVLARGVQERLHRVRRKPFRVLGETA